MSAIKSGRILANQPRAVMVREPENDINDPHSAISGAVNILVDSQLEAKKIMDAWPEITDALRLKIEEVLGRENPPGAAAPNIEEKEG